MPNLFSSLRECLGFSQSIKSDPLMTSIARSDMSCKLPIGVATIVIPRSILLIFIFIYSCTPIDISTQSEQSSEQDIIKEQKVTTNKERPIEKINIVVSEEKNNQIIDTEISKEVTILFSNKSKKSFTKQFINVLELATYNKKLSDVSFNLIFFDNEDELIKIISEPEQKGKIFIGPLETNYTEIAKNFCDRRFIFFAFSADSELAEKCIYLINFFPKNELEQLLSSLNNKSKVALLYPENIYGYKINGMIDEVINQSDAILINRSSYKNDLSNVRDAIKELGKYELRKYELERQKQILLTKNDKESKKRLEKLRKFKTTKDYDFTHILLADYGINLLQVAPLLPYYDIDPNVIQFMSTGVIDDKNFFLEPSLQGTIFPGIEKSKRSQLMNEYLKIYNENMLRISTLPYDLVGILDYIYSKKLTYNQALELLNSSKIKFNGIDGEFYFKNNVIERELDILEISNGYANKIN